MVRGDDDDCMSLHHLIKIYGRWIDSVDGVYISTLLCDFLYTRISESERRHALIGRSSAFVLHM